MYNCKDGTIEWHKNRKFLLSTTATDGRNFRVSLLMGRLIFNPIILSVLYLYMWLAGHA
jgi:hypothetical protein